MSVYLSLLVCGSCTGANVRMGEFLERLVTITAPSECHQMYLFASGWLQYENVPVFCISELHREMSAWQSWYVANRMYFYSQFLFGIVGQVQKVCLGATGWRPAKAFLSHRPKGMQRQELVNLRRYHSIFDGADCGTASPTGILPAPQKLRNVAKLGCKEYVRLEISYCLQREMWVSGISVCLYVRGYSLFICLLLMCNLE